MTAGPAENQAADQAQSQGEAAAVKHLTDARQQHEASGSAFVVEDASTPDDTAVDWPPGTPDDGAQPTLIPSSPQHPV